jgi:hypothetical protein
MPNNLHYIFGSRAPQSPAKPLQGLIVLKKNAAHCRRWVKLQCTLPEDEARAKTVLASVKAIGSDWIETQPFPHPTDPNRLMKSSLLDATPEQIASAYPGAPIELRLRFYASSSWRRSWNIEIVRIGIEHSDLYSTDFDTE